MKKIFFTLSILFILITLTTIGCKKDNTPSGGGSFSVNNPNSYTLSATGDISGTYSGFLLTSYESDPSYSVSTAQGGFYNTPVPLQVSIGSNISMIGTVSSVYINNVLCKKSAYDNSYFDTTNALVFPPAKWLVNGNATIPSFTYTCNTAKPVYNPINLPATIDRTKDLVISMSGSSGYDQIEMSISDNIYGSISVFAAANATSITFVKDSLAKLSSTTTGDLNVVLIKYDPQLLGGKNFLFGTIYTYDKSPIILK